MNVRMNLRRQVLLGYLAPLAATLLIVIVSVVTLQMVVNSDRHVTNVDARQVADVYRLIGAVNARASDSRGFLLSRDPALRAALGTDDEQIEKALAALDGAATDAEARRLLAQARVARDAWLAASGQVQGQVLAGASPAQITQAFATRQAPSLTRLQDALGRVAQIYERQGQRALQRSAAKARDARLLVAGLGLVALALALGLGLWLAARITRRLSRLALTVDAAVAEVLAGTTQQVAGSAHQAAAVQQTVSTVEELVQTAQQSAERARAVAEQAQRAVDVSQEGSRAVADSAAGMVAIRDQVTSTATTVIELAERAQAISGIVSAVEEIAGQTHLLALNAAIEAARAGEHGRGFSVVAGEVRSLAAQSRRATSQVSQILAEIQDGTTTAVMASEEGTKRVVDGVGRTEQAGRTIQELADSVAMAAEAGEQIAASSVQQAIVTGQIGEAMRNIEQVMDQNSASAREAEQAARDLHRVATELKELVGASFAGR